MPNSIVRSFAEKSNRSIAEVEKLWAEASEKAGEKFKVKNDHFYAYVTATVKKILGISESVKFSDFNKFLTEEK